MLKINKFASRLFLAVFVLFGTAVGSTAAIADGEKFVLVSHAPDSDSWWNTIKNAIGIAGEP
jgi:simple sugar transport system substrate-binding protein